MQNPRLDVAQTGIEIAGRNISNLSYADDTTLMAESEEELKSLLMKVKEKSEKIGLKLSIQQTKIMASSPITSWQIDGEAMDTVIDFIFLDSKITADGDLRHEIKDACSLEEKLWPTSVQFSSSVVSDSLQPHAPQHSRPPCPSPTPRGYTKSHPLSRQCHPIISSSVIPFSSCPQSFPESGSFQMSQLFASVGQSIGVSASASVLPMDTQDWSPLGWTGWISFRMDWLDLLAVQGTLKSLLQHHSSKPSILWRSAFFVVQLSHPYMTTGKTIALTRWTFVDKVMSLLFNMLSKLVITFLPRSKHLLISWLQPPSAVILEPRKINSDTVSTDSWLFLIVSGNNPQQWSKVTDICFVSHVCFAMCSLVTVPQIVG